MDDFDKGVVGWIAAVVALDGPDDVEVEFVLEGRQVGVGQDSSGDFRNHKDKQEGQELKKEKKKAARYHQHRP